MAERHAVSHGLPKKRKREKKNVHECCFCDLKFETKKAHVEHYQEKHCQDGMRKITCTKCLKCFDTVKSLKHHFKSVHLDMKGFKCDHCGRKFRDRFSLNFHEQIHGNKLAPGVSNLCSMCGNVFVDEKSLKRHVGIVHSNKKSIKCIQCPKRFRDKYGLIRHLNKKHGEENKDETKDDGNNNSQMKMDENKKMRHQGF